MYTLVKYAFWLLHVSISNSTFRWLSPIFVRFSAENCQNLAQIPFYLQHTYIMSLENTPVTQSINNRRAIVLVLAVMSSILKFADAVKP